MPDAIPDWMEFPRVEVWTPFAFAPRPGISEESIRGARDNTAIGRLKAGVSLKQAQADLSRIADNLARIHPIDRGVGVVVKPLSDTRVGPLRPALLMLMGAVTLILLISCTNLANLLLARNSVRTRELVMRVALGAGRSELIRQLLVETVLLSLIGGGAGFLLAWGGCAALDRVHPEQLPQLGMVELDWRVLLFTVVISVLTGVACGVLPAITATRVNLVDALKEGGRTGTAGVGRQYLRRALVIAEVAFSLMLVAGAGVLIQSVIRLQAQTTGIREDHLLKAHFYLPPVHYSDSGSVTRFCERFAERIRALPGVIDASVTSIYPPSGRWQQIFSIEGQPPPDSLELPTARFGVTDDHFVRTLRVPLIRGRDFDKSDTESREPVALINQELVARYFGHRDPIGARLHVGQPEGRTVSAPPNPIAAGYARVVGMVGNFRNNGLALPVEPQLILLFRQEPSVNSGFKDVVVRTVVDPQSIAPAIRHELHLMDPNLPLAEVQTIQEFISKQTSDQRFVTSLLSIFAALGLILAVVGVYGVVSFLVTQRFQELGVRLAMGARPSNVLWLVVKQGMTMGAIGVAAGMLGASATGKLLAQLVFQVSATDIVTLGTASFTLLAIAVMASVVPGARAMRIDPAIALRQE